MTDEVNEVVTPDSTQEQVETPSDVIESTPEETTPQTPEEKKYSQSELDTQIKEAKAKASAKAAAIAERRALKAYAEKLEAMSVKAEPKADTQSDSGEPQMVNFHNVNDYVKAMVRWDRQQEQAQVQQTQQQKQQVETQSKVQSIFEKAESISTFDRDVFESLPVSEAAAWTIMESDRPELIMAHLCQNPQEAERIANLSPARQAAEIGKLEAKLTTVTKETKSVSVSKAPEPITPIGNKGASQKEPSEMSDSEFAVWRKRQIAQRR